MIEVGCRCEIPSNEREGCKLHERSLGTRTSSWERGFVCRRALQEGQGEGSAFRLYSLP